MCKALLIAFLGTTSPGHVIKIPAAKLAGYSPDQIEWAKGCAHENGVRWIITGKRRYGKR